MLTSNYSIFRSLLNFPRHSIITPFYFIIKREKSLHLFDSQSILVTRRSVSSGIAFSAQLTVQQTHIHIGTVIKFDKMTLNDASGYNKQTGVFTVPEGGVCV
jgi:hypothetical protein